MRVIALFLLLIGAAAGAETNSPPIVQMATPLPEFSFTDLDGHSLVSSNYSGKALLIWYFLANDQPCLRQLPILKALQHDYQAKRLNIIGMALDTGGPEAVKKFASTNHITFPIVMMDGQFIQGSGGVTAVPTILVVEKHSQIISRNVGVTDRATLEPLLEAIFKEAQ